MYIVIFDCQVLMKKKVGEITGKEGLRRTFELLWGEAESPRRGPRPRLTTAEIVQIAIKIADEEGVAGLTVRRLAEQTNISPMSFYTYIPDTDQLHDLMLDAVFAEIIAPKGHRTGWRARLEWIARQNRDLYLRHPWILRIATHRPVLGPNSLAKYELELRALDGFGLDEIEMDLTRTLILDYVHGAVRDAIEMASVEKQTGMSDTEWWSVNRPLLDRVFDPKRYPVLARVGPKKATSPGNYLKPESAFEYGLQCLLDGVAKRIMGRSKR